MHFLSLQAHHSGTLFLVPICELLNRPHCSTIALVKEAKLLMNQNGFWSTKSILKSISMIADHLLIGVDEQTQLLRGRFFVQLSNPKPVNRVVCVWCCHVPSYPSSLRTDHTREGHVDRVTKKAHMYREHRFSLAPFRLN